VYNHAEAKGPMEVYKMKNINEQAKARFNEDVDVIKNQKEFQKN